jgi:4'-phosphopantetheinyl transferase
LHVPALNENNIHVWNARLPGGVSQQQYLEGLLSGDESGRRARFQFEDDRRNFAFARGLLRSLLAAYCGGDPRELRFRYSEHGKPSLAGPAGEEDLQFNLSHSRGAVLVAICRGRAVGVDIEKVREDVNPQEIAARFFSLAEQRALMSLAKAEQRQAFFRCWTRKEAFLKARGHGLSFPLERFDVSMGAEETEVSLTTRPDPAEAERWAILPVPAPEGYAAAVAAATGLQSAMGGEGRWHSRCV